MPCSRASAIARCHARVRVQVARAAPPVPALESRRARRRATACGADVDDAAANHPHEAGEPVEPVRVDTVAIGVGEEPGAAIGPRRLHPGLRQRLRQDIDAARRRKLSCASDGDGSVLAASAPTAIYAHDSAPSARSPRDLLPAVASPLRSVRREDPLDRRTLEGRTTARPSSPSRGATRRAAGPSGRRGFSSAPRCCSSMPPTTSVPRSRPRAHVERMAPHLTHMGVHDHGFNNVSTYGNALAARARGAHRRRATGRSHSTSWRSRSAAPCRRGAGRACRTAASSTRSTARIRCSSTPSDRCASLALGARARAAR